MIKIKHFINCTADYPEKPIEEKPQEIMKIEIDENEVVHQCSDCGAFVIVKNNHVEDSDR
jgi:ssDNA-binding Zn-finger/Zn-ribbon topoisomerase 1